MDLTILEKLIERLGMGRSPSSLASPVLSSQEGLPKDPVDLDKGWYDKDLEKTTQERLQALPSTSPKDDHLKAQAKAWDSDELDVIDAPNPYSTDPALRPSSGPDLEYTGFGPNPLWKEFIKRKQEAEGKVPVIDPSKRPMPTKPDVKDAEDEESPWSGRGFVGNLGYGLAALGDAFSSAGGGKAGFLNNIMKNRQFLASEQRKMYDAEQQAALKEMITKAQVLGKEQDVASKKKKMGVFEIENTYGHPQVKLMAEGMRGEEALQPLWNMYEINPEKFIKRHSVKSLTKEIESMRKKEQKHRNLKYTKSAQEQTDYKADWISDDINKALYETLYSHRDYDATDAKYIEHVVAPTIAKRRKELDTAFTKAAGDKNIVNREVLDSSNEILKVLMKANQLSELAWDDLVIDPANDTVTDKRTGEKLKVPGGEFSGVAVNMRGARAWLAQHVKFLETEGLENELEWWGMVEQFFGKERLAKSGKAVTKPEMGLFNTGAQMKGFKNKANIMSGIRAIRDANLNSMKSRWQNVRGLPGGNAYIKVRAGRLDPESYHAPVKSDDQRTFAEVFDDTWNRGQKKGEGGGAKALQENPATMRYISHLQAYLLKANKTPKTMWWFDKSEKKFHQGLDIKSDISESMTDNKRWLPSRSWASVLVYKLFHDKFAAQPNTGYEGYK